MYAFCGESSTASDDERTASMASSASRSAASRGSISSEKIDVRLDCICGIVLLLRT
jgi:3-oxoacyl-[acyl-carrier-protein] synthase III